MTTQPIQLYPHLRLTDRLVALVAWSVAVGLFVTVGWRALRPVDPQGAVSMLTSANPWLMVVQMAVLGAVVAALATLLVGRKLADAGLFATCLGLAVANLRADTLESILISVANGGHGAGRSLEARFLFEALVWFAIVLLAMLTSAWVLRWCFGRGDAEDLPVLSAMSAAELPMIASLLTGRGDADHRRWARTGLWHMLFTAGLAFGLIGLFSATQPAPAIRHGQVYFSIAAAFCVAGYFAHHWFPARTALWGCLAVPLVTAAAYVWAMLDQPGQHAGLPANIPHSSYMRALPLEYVILGTIGSLLAFWWTRHIYAVRVLHEPSIRKPAR